MRIERTLIRVFFVAIGLCLIGGMPAIAGPITMTVPVLTIDGPPVRQADGLFKYEYTLSNPIGSTFNPLQLQIGVDIYSSLTNFTGPTGWKPYLNLYGNPLYAYTDWDSHFADSILPGNSAMFSFESPLGPGPQNTFLLSLSADHTQYNRTDAQIIAPVPEPTTLALAAFIGAGVLVCRFQRSINAPVLS